MVFTGMLWTLRERTNVCVCVRIDARTCMTYKAYKSRPYNWEQGQHISEDMSIHQKKKRPIFVCVISYLLL